VNSSSKKTMSTIGLEAVVPGRPGPDDRSGAELNAARHDQNSLLLILFPIGFDRWAAISLLFQAETALFIFAKTEASWRDYVATNRVNHEGQHHRSRSGVA
jgi:hypothetical protein